MNLRMHARLLWMELGLAVVFCGGAVAQESPGEKAVVVERELATRFDAGRKWAVLVGINNYLDQDIPSLRYCAADVRLLAKTLAEKCGYEAKRILVISDDQQEDHLRPLGINIRQQVRGWLKKAEPGDTVLVSFSGHGFLDDRGQGFLAPKDCEKTNLGLTGFRIDDLRDMLHQCRATQKVLILDCCHSGGGKGVDVVGPSSHELGMAFQKAAGLITLASCDNREKSQEWDAKGQGLFTYFLVQGLQGAADYDQNGLIDSYELHRYTMDEVSLTAQTKLHAQQTPKLLLGEDVKGVFALARVDRKPGASGMRRQVTATFTVREGDENGPTFAGAKLELIYRKTKEAEAVVLGRGTSDKDGTARIPLWLDAKQQTEGEFLVVVSAASSTDTRPMPGFPKSLHCNVYVASPGPAKTIVNSIGMKLVLIPAGEFMMGSRESVDELVKAFAAYEPKREWFESEYPCHRVRITKPFYLDAHEVTVGQFRKFVADAGYQTDAEKGEQKGAFGYDPEKKAFVFHAGYSWRNAGFEQTDDHPVVNVSWNDAVAFCQWLSQKEGKAYRLPTEAEWEYACRARTTTRYWSGDDPEALTDVGNVADATARAKFPIMKNSTRNADGHVFTAPVGQFKANPFGLYDMYGNASEWCADWFDAGYYGRSSSSDPQGPDSGTHRVLRGGSWRSRPNFARSANRDRIDPATRYNYNGFRVARNP